MADCSKCSGKGWYYEKQIIGGYTFCDRVVCRCLKEKHGKK